MPDGFDDMLALRGRVIAEGGEKIEWIATAAVCQALEIEPKELARFHAPARHDRTGWGAAGRMSDHLRNRQPANPPVWTRSTWFDGQASVGSVVMGPRRSRGCKASFGSGPNRQHSLPSRRYSLPRPVFHRLDRTSLRLAPLFNDLIGEVEQRRRNLDAERS